MGESLKGHGSSESFWKAHGVISNRMQMEVSCSGIHKHS